MSAAARAWRRGLGAALACAAIALPCARLVDSGFVPEPATAPSTATPKQAAAADAFVGERVCASCHARQAATWRGSHHQLAMQPATARSVLGRFDGAQLHEAGVTSTLFEHAGRFVARTDGPDGALHDYPIAWTFGVAPLQQYLVPFPGGRWQALAVAWDSRPARAGGQRWFHLHAGEHIGAGDPLHWTGASANWNFMCADCHSTNVRKAYDPARGSYATRYEEVSVSCEACHGPGSRHAADPTRPLPQPLDERRGVAWTRDPLTHEPRRSRPRATVREIELCARCHARRAILHEDFAHGQRLDDDYRVALLDDDLYWPDGQVKAEVYEYGSFVQSRMFAEGVTCSDCHEPHRPELRASGDNLCLSCHAEATYFTPRHHFHRAGSPGARCVACHMPATTFMTVDARRDHSLRVPRPDLSQTLGVPNPCNGCHADRSAAWAARTVARWYGHTPAGRQRFGEALAAARRGAPDAVRRLVALVADRGQPAIARASAIERLAPRLSPATLPSVQSGLDDSDALVRRAAVAALAPLDPALRAPLVAPSLEDPVRAVRIEAVLALAGVPPSSLSPSQAAALAGATDEFVAAQALAADRPEAHQTLAHWHLRAGRFDRAESELERALAIDPAFVPAAVNLADLYRTLERDRDGEAVLRAALGHARDNPALRHALGLVLVREQRLPEALAQLAAAARRGPENPRFGYVYGVALYGAGRTREALAALAAVIARHPYDRDSLAALAAFARDRGDTRAAERWADRLAALDPR